MNVDIVTPVVELMYVSIKGEGINGAMPGEPEKMKYQAIGRIKKDSKELKDFQKQLTEIWKSYCKEFNVKGSPATNGIKPELVNSDKLDEYGNPIKVETDYVLITFKTGTTFKDGNPRKIPLYHPNQTDITELYHKQEWTIGNGTKGVIHGVASPNNVGGKHKITLYLSGLQLHSNLVKYTGNNVKPVKLEGADMSIEMEADIELADASGVEI